ncbi:MAG: c-type cytochrome [Thermoleophilia bacterium]|nr:c-type cytochrome [Thermoleophilia bacterium]
MESSGRHRQASRRRVRSVAAGLAVAAAVLVPATGAWAADDGKAVFDQLCQGCHSIGGGDKAGPDLAGLADRRDRDWAEQFILAPDTVIASGDATAKELVAKYGAPMPNLAVTQSQADALLTHLGYADTAAPAPATPEPAAPATPAPAGDAERGKALFTGGNDFVEGGPSCLACHSVAGIGSLGGGQVGPDLTGAYAKFGGQQGLQAALKSVPFPTMAPIFQREPLTASEQADLTAFLADAPNRSRTSDAAAKLLGLSVGLAVIVAALALLLWRGRLTGVRRALVNQVKESRLR